jgi:hypothetical protein
MVPGVFELDMTAKPGNSNAQASALEVPRHRQAA